MKIRPLSKRPFGDYLPSSMKASHRTASMTVHRGPGSIAVGWVACISLSAAFGSDVTAQERTQTQKILSSVEIKSDQGQTQLLFKGKWERPDYGLRTRDQGKTLVIDLKGVSLPPKGLSEQGTSQLISRTSASTTARGVRLEVALRRQATYRARATETGLTVMLEPVGGAGEKEETLAQGKPSDSAKKVQSRVENVHIETRDGRERVVVTFHEVDNDGTDFRVIPGDDGPARLEIKRAQAGDNLASVLQGSTNGSIQKVRLLSENQALVIEADRKPGVKTTAIREGRRIVWMFSEPVDANTRPKAKTIAVDDKIAAPEGNPGSAEISTGQVAGFFTTSPPFQAKAIGPKTQSVASGGKYSARRIDLDFKDADIHNILRLLAEVGGVNVVTSDDVKGTVTIRMKNVPWDQALDVVLQAKGLGMVRSGNMIRVAPQDALEKEREAAIARQKQNVELAPLETRLIPVSYAQAESLKPRVSELLSTRGTVSTDERTNVLIVRDLGENLDDVEELIRTLDTQTPQVLVEARIVEATSQYTKDIGIQWGGDATWSGATGNPTGLTFPSNLGLAGGNFNQDTPTQGLSPVTGASSSPNFAVNLPATTGNGQGGALGLTMGSVNGNFNLNVRLSAAEAHGVVRIISSPRVLTLDNREAHIAQGTLIPYSQISAQGIQTAFQEAKLQLIVKPHVTSDGAVGMHVKVTRDEPDFTRTSARGDPTILKREAETDLLVTDGHTAVIGGIFTRNTGRNVDQIPFLGDIPILGVLFQRRRTRDERNELLIFLTPRIVNRQLALQK